MTSRIHFIHQRKAQLDQELAIQKNRFLSATFKGVSAARKDAQFIRPEYILLLAGGFAAWRLLTKKRLDPAHAPDLGWTQETLFMNSLPPSLRGHSAQGLIENQPIAQFEIGDGHNLIYLIIDWQTREAAIVDPQSDLAPPLEALKKHGISLRQILLTHTHGDHTAGVPALAQINPELPISVHDADLHRLPRVLKNHPSLRKINDGQTLKIGHIEVKVLHTPGHSAGECCFWVSNTTPPYLLTGDTVFIRDCGRTDLPSGNPRELFESLQRIKKLPLETVILPGHHYQKEVASTLQREMTESPPFRCKTVAELETLP